jgi:hypothetical protein
VGAYVAGGTGLAALAAAGAFAIDTVLQANDARAACPTGVCQGTEVSLGRADVSAAQTAQTTAIVLLVAGVVLGSTATGLYFTGGARREGSAPAVSVGLLGNGLAGEW